MKVPNCRYPLILSSLVAALALAGCKGDVLDYRNAQLVNGKVYAGDANKPFSGTLTNVPSGIVLESQSGFRKVVASIERVLPTLTYDYVQSVGIDNFPTDPRIPVPVYCDTHVDNGILDGKAVCKASNTDNVRLEMAFQGGRPDGQLTIYTPDGASQKLATIAFRDGEPDGRQEIYSPTTHRLVHASNWTKGAPEGQEEGFDENTGNRILIATYVNGQVNGPFTRYAADGKQITYRAIFVNGKPEGTEETYDPMTGKLTGRAEYTNGLLNGTVKRWNADGKLVYEKDYQNGQESLPAPAVTACLDRRYTTFYRSGDLRENVNSEQRNQWEAECKEEFGASASSTRRSESAATTSSSDSDMCVSIWTAAFHRENGDDAIVTTDQLNEWQSWCKKGKRPS
ncbi:toxin-antitoxin system YwqK family antitoxin [Burkholderia stagnalis]|uniref:toxin-antitoxin system YwqK family antitoxin n=1 Tax=Burkholderia stagnalis TaxID=1503054 RepID=UPI000A41B1D2|nr:toxin-antitoxin system YwqK family antitoxin [Burkholderia stagnalis]